MELNVVKFIGTSSYQTRKFITFSNAILLDDYDALQDEDFEEYEDE